MSGVLSPMKIDADTYQDAALEHVELARELYTAGRYVFALYAAGVSAECVMRALARDPAFEGRHDLRVLLDQSDLLGDLSAAEAKTVSAAVSELWSRWKNTHRYFSAARLKRFIIDNRLHHRIKGDPVKENVRRAINCALIISGKGAKAWTR